MRMPSQTLAEVGGVVKPLDVDTPLESAVLAFSQAGAPAILESTQPGGRWARYSIFACDPIEVFEFAASTDGCPFQALHERTAAWPRVVADEAHPGVFAGGWIGFFSYEAGLTVERIRPRAIRDVNLPLARFALYDRAAVFDHQQSRWYASAVDWPASSQTATPTTDQRLAHVERMLRRAASESIAAPHHVSAMTPFRANLSRQAYLDRVGHIKRLIFEGDVYQVNLTQRWSTRVNATALEVYRNLRRVNPATYAAYLPWGRMAVISASPELFLDVRGRDVITRPIKGTRPRTGDPPLDRRRRDELGVSEKDRAELTMIIDLLRNDLGRVCEFGSIRVEEEGAIEAHPTVFHRVATIAGRLRSDTTWADLLRATLPGGSITGAPKIAAMKVIDDLEPTARGVYCGAIGWLGLDGAVSLNVAIRTMVQVDDAVHVYAGGGIVADSVAEDEYAECLAKAAGMMRAIKRLETRN